MKIDVLTVLPGIFAGPFQEGMIRKAQELGLVVIEVVDLRDYTHDRHRTTDDYPFGGGPGMIMKVEPVVEAVEARGGTGEAARILVMSPAGRRFDQALAAELAGEAHLVLICGRYEGYDDRIPALLGAEEVSLGDFVLSGGEFAALSVVDAVVRLLPGVLHKPGAVEDESFSSGLLEAPQFTRPREYRGHAVPEVLLSGDHARIAAWRRREALRRTWKRRPDLLRHARLTPEERAWVEARLAGGDRGKVGCSGERENSPDNVML